MSSQKPSANVRKRDDVYVDRTVTRIWQELPAEDNAYVTTQSRCHGYDLMALMEKRSFVDVFYLLFRGELPTPDEAALFEALMVGFINPGPRHPATRAAMNAGVGKTDPALILPIALATLSGKHNAAGSLEEGMRFLRKQQRNPAQDVALQLLEKTECPAEGDCIIAPGFGSHYSGIDLMSKQIAEYFLKMSASGAALKWGQDFAETLNEESMGWLSTGVVAAVLTDLGFQPRAAAGIYQIISAPGLFAHGVELANKPMTAMPFIDDKDYYIEYEK